MLLAATGTGEVLVELGAVLIVLALLCRVAHRIGLSPIPLYLLAGLVIGEGGLVDIGPSREFIEVAAAVGVVLLLFLLGLEYSAGELLDTLRTQAPSGGIDLVLNFTPGFCAGLLLGWSTVEAVVLGGVTFITSSGIVAKLLDDLGRIGNRETPVILSILVMEDLVMAFYLPLVAGLLVGGSALATTGSIAAALVTVVVVIAAARWFGPTLSRWIFSQSSEALLLSILGLTLLVAGIAEGLQVSAAVGAFLVGIALSGPAADRAEPLLRPLRDLFAAAFFVLFGLDTDPASLPDGLAPAAALAVVTAATKVLTGWWAARRAGVGTRGRWRAGATLIARGEFSVVIAGLAVAAGSDSDVGILAADYVLILAFAGPVAARVVEPLLRWRMPASSAVGPGAG
jgi:CPA2 family monovalent cation:H+ antiporter-2